MAGGDAALRVLLTVHHDLVEGTGAAGSTLALAARARAARPPRRGRRARTARSPTRGGARRARVPARRSPGTSGHRLARGSSTSWTPRPGTSRTSATERVRAAPPAVFTRSHGLEQLNAARRQARARAAGSCGSDGATHVYHGGLRLREVARSLRVADARAAPQRCRGLLRGRGARASPRTALHRTSELLRDAPRAGAATEPRDVLVLSPDILAQGCGRRDPRPRGGAAILAGGDRLVARPRATPPRSAPSWAHDVRDRVALGGAFDAATLAIAARRAPRAPLRVASRGARDDGPRGARPPALPVVAATCPAPATSSPEARAGSSSPTATSRGWRRRCDGSCADEAWRAELAERGRARAATYRWRRWSTGWCPATGRSLALKAGRSPERGCRRRTLPGAPQRLRWVTSWAGRLGATAQRPVG